MASFKEMVKSGAIKRADAMQVLLDDIHEEPGFNLREEGEDLEASIEALADHIAGGGQYPALEVRPRDAGGVWVVDGHRRRRALLRCLDRGVPLASPKDGKVWVHVVAFTGNDADRTARILTSAENKTLSQIEIAKGYKRLAAFNWTPAEIAKKVGKTEVHIRNLLALANANSDVHGMVARGEVSGSVAAKMVRQHGEGAGKVLAAAHADAKAKGKDKVMPKAVAKLSNAAAVAPIDTAARHADLFTQYAVTNYPDLTEKLTALITHLQGRLRTLQGD